MIPHAVCYLTSVGKKNTFSADLKPDWAVPGRAFPVDERQMIKKPIFTWSTLGELLILTGGSFLSVIHLALWLSH